MTSYFFDENEINGVSYSEEDVEIEIQLFNISIDWFSDMNENKSKQLYSIKNKFMNDLPLIGAFCSSKCILEDILIYKDKIDYKFRFERESIKFIDGRPIRVIENVIIECRYFISMSLAVVISGTEKEKKAILSIIYTIPNYISLIFTREVNFTYSVPKFGEVSLDSKRLNLIKEFFQDKLIAYVNSENQKQYEVIGLKDYLYIENQEIVLKSTKLRGKYTAVEFYFKSSKDSVKKKISIAQNGIIFSTAYIEKNVVEEIINIIYLLYKNIDNSDFLKSTDSILDDYCKYIHSHMSEEAKDRIRHSITSQLNILAKEACKCEKDNVSMVYMTVILNILVKLVYNTRGKTDDMNIDILEYSHIADFIEVYIRNKYKKVITEEEIESIMLKLCSIISYSKGNTEKLISYYNTHYS